MINLNPIAIGISPNTGKDDVTQALKTIFQPWIWKAGKDTKLVEKWFSDYLGVSDAVSFNSGRSALYSILKCLGIGSGDEVIIQAFTCVAVPDPIIWVGASAVYSDIDSTLNVDPLQLKKLINRKTKAIIVQHTFGIPANIREILKITRKHKISLIEDCSHSLGAKYSNQKIGTFGDFAFFSFGRDKVISSVFGGMAISKIKVQSEKLREFQRKLPFPKNCWIIQQLFHPVLFSFILPLYDLFWGKLILYVLYKLQVISKPVEYCEKSGLKPDKFPAKYPNALARLLLRQLNKLESFNNHRREIAQFYYTKLISGSRLTLPPKAAGSVYLRFNILIDKSKELLGKAKKEKIILGNWYHTVIDPEGVDYKKVGYEWGTCPHAEKAAEKSVNLPTYPRLDLKQADTIIRFIKRHYL